MLVNSNWRLFQVLPSRTAQCATIGAVALLVASTLTGCALFLPDRAEEEPEPEAPAAFPADYERSVDPFDVRDTDGELYDYPFLGGLTNPRPQFVDITGTGYPDLFVQERGNQLMFFENVEAEDGERELVWRTDQFQDLRIGQWYRFVDAHGEGTYDLLAEAPYNHIRYFRNTGTREDPEFTLAADTLRDVEGNAIFSDRQNIPNIADIDCDGEPDLFLGLLDGTITRYNADGFDEDGVPEFELVTQRFEGIEIISEFGTMRHGANSFTFTDHDGDDIIDLFWGDFFEPSLLLLENMGSCGNPNYSTEPELFPPNDPVSTSGYNAPDFADWTGNGIKDLFVGVVGGAHDANSTLADNFLYYEALGPDEYELRTERFLKSIDVGGESTAAFGDLTGNGAEDLLLANRIDPDDRQTSTVHFFANVGTPSAPEFEERGTLDLPEEYDYAPALGDLTGNGELDLVLGTWQGDLQVYRNAGMDDGLPQFEHEEDWSEQLPRGSTSIPTLVDLTGNDRLDLVSGGSDGRVHLYRNEGTAETPDFERQEGAFEDVKVARRSAPAFHDVDGTGTLDLVVGSEGDGLVLHRNLGTAEAPIFDGTPELVDLDMPRYTTPLFVDLFDTGNPALVSGGRSGGLVLFSPDVDAPDSPY